MLQNSPELKCQAGRGSGQGQVYYSLECGKRKNVDSEFFEKLEIRVVDVNFQFILDMRKVIEILGTRGKETQGSASEMLQGSRGVPLGQVCSSPFSLSRGKGG